MREERVMLTKIDAEKLIQAAKNHLQELGMKIIDEDSFEGYHSIKAYRGGNMALVTGSIRDVELLITGTEKNYELRLRTGAWGRDMAIPAMIGGILTKAGTTIVPDVASKVGDVIATSASTIARSSLMSGSTVAASAPFAAGIAIAAIEAYRAGKFEKNFWKWLKNEISRIGIESTMGKPEVIKTQSGLTA